MTGSIAMRDANGNPVSVATTLVGSVQAPIHVLTNGSGTPYSADNPLLTAPAIAAAQPVDRGGTVSAANVAQPVMAANSERKGGWITASPRNSGYLYVSLTGQASTTGGQGIQSILAPGATCPLTINGFVIPTAVSIAGDTAGDVFSAVEFQ